MTTADFSSYLTTAFVESPSAGSRPVFDNPTKKYTPVGGEKKEVKPEEAAQQESSFLSKYWMYILLAFLVLPRLFEGDAPSLAAPARA
jgi:hypothetical protein